MKNWILQEIGFIDTKKKEEKLDFDLYPVGSILTLVPYHACATAACYDQYYIHDDEGIIQQIWKPCKGWWKFHFCILNKELFY